MSSTVITRVMSIFGRVYFPSFISNVIRSFETAIAFVFVSVLVIGIFTVYLLASLVFGVFGLFSPSRAGR